MINAKVLKELTEQYTVLYAEDEAMLRDTMTATLEKFFKKVHVAKDGFEAFDIFKREAIDILITDINMPILNGIGLIDKIHETTDRPPVIIVLSAHNESNLLIKLINKGIDRFLGKPVEKERMLETFYKVCKQLNDSDLIRDYEKQLQLALDEAERKNKALEQKLHQLAIATNKNRSAETKTHKPSVNESYFDHLVSEDKEELAELSSELDNLIAMFFLKEQIRPIDIDNVSLIYHKYGSVLNTYPEFTEVGMALESLSAVIVAHQDKILIEQEQSGIFIESFQMTLENFRTNIWNRRASDPTFYNASLLSDISVLTNFLEGADTIEGDIEFF